MSKINYSKVELTLSVYDACRTNTERARKPIEKHYNINVLAEISGVNIERTLNNLQYCAENKKDELAITVIRNIANALLSTYEIQRSSYN